MKAKLTRITPIVLSTTLLCGGCEILAPLLIAESTSGEDPASLTTAPLAVEVESASGTLEGRPLAPEMITPTGDRVGTQLTFRLAIDEDLEVMVITDSESSNQNPYASPPDDAVAFPEGDGRPTADGLPSEPARADDIAFEQFADVLVCDAITCQSASDFGIELVQAEDGRTAVVEGNWEGDEHVTITLHYTESH